MIFICHVCVALGFFISLKCLNDIWVFFHLKYSLLVTMFPWWQPVYLLNTWKILKPLKPSQINQTLWGSLLFTCPHYSRFTIFLVHSKTCSDSTTAKNQARELQQKRRGEAEEGFSVLLHWPNNWLLPCNSRPVTMVMLTQQIQIERCRRDQMCSHISEQWLT